MSVIKRLDVERYEIFAEGEYANIFISNTDLVIVSSFGDWNQVYYLDSNHDFKKFLISLDIDHLKYKLMIGKPYEYNHEKAIEILEKSLRDDFERESINQNQLDDFMKEIRVLKREDFRHEDVLYCYMTENNYEMIDYFSEIAEYPDVTTMPAGLDQFMKILWPEFIKEITKEI